MKCLSVRQPWAWMIFHGKTVENRTWPSKYRGPLLIHASLTLDYEGMRWLIKEEFTYPNVQEIAYGAIIGQVNMIDCVTSHPSPYFFGPYGFVFENPMMFVQKLLGHQQISTTQIYTHVSMDAMKEATKVLNR